jgi:acyl carrier protein
VDIEQIRAVITGLVRDMDGVAAGQVSATASVDELGVDSMSTMDLLRKVEDEFGVEVPDEQLPMIGSIEDLVNFVASVKQEVGR